MLTLLAGCGKKSPSKSEIHSITEEIVSAAQQVAGRKSEITIRPEMGPSEHGSKGRLAADDIYISLQTRSQANVLRQALIAIAAHHDLSFAESFSSGVIRYDLLSNDTRTHTIHLITPLPVRLLSPASRPQGGAELAIILDDLGHDRASADAVLALPFPVTVSVLPRLPESAEVAEEAYRRGDEVMLHLPMEPLSEGDPSEGAVPEQVELRLGMNPGQIATAVENMLETVPHAAGVNNHQGSRATADPALMQALMPVLREHNLFFIDSRTTAATVAYDSAETAGVRAASRKVFLDDTPTREAVLAQLDLAARDALRDGSAIAIGHPHPATIAALADRVPDLESRGIRLVFASDLAH